MPFWKPEPHAKVKRRQQARSDVARRKCCDTCWERSGSHCECTGCPNCTGPRCGTFVKRWSKYFREVGQVDEIIPRSQGGDPTDPDNCRVVCYDCHFSGPSGAHRVTRR